MLSRLRIASLTWVTAGQLAVVSLVGGACWGADSLHGSADQSASAARTAPPTPSSVPNAFLAGDCTYPATGGTRTQPADDKSKTVISVPQGWTRQVQPWADQRIFQLAAPSGYQYGPTTIDIAVLFPDSPHHSPERYLAGITEVNYTVVGQIQTCTIEGDQAAYLQFTLPSRPGFKGSRAGYMVVWLHSGLAYLLNLEGSGDVDPRAIQDAKGILASLSYTQTS